MTEAVIEARRPEEGLDVSVCLRAVRLGDNDAAGALLSHLYPLVISVVRGHLPRRLAEEDLAQMIFMKVFSKLDQFSGTVPLEHWVSRIAVNTCLNALQAERIRPELRWADLSEEEEHVIQSLAATTEDLEPGQSLSARDLVTKLLACLAPKDRLVITLLHMEGRSVEEIRQLTGWNISMIKVRAFRARHKLRKHLATLMRSNRGSGVAGCANPGTPASAGRGSVPKAVPGISQHLAQASPLPDKSGVPPGTGVTPLPAGLASGSTSRPARSP